MSPHVPGCERISDADILFMEIGVNKMSTTAAENVAGVEGATSTQTCV